MVSPPSSQIRAGAKFNTFERDFSSQPFTALRDDASSNPARVLDESTALKHLKDLVAAGHHRLETMLATLTDVACRLTGANGAALAMWKDGAMICRARSGDIAPPLGARLSADTGISGECLRTGKVLNCADSENDPLVDVEVCRRLGLRSIVVLPIQGWRGINGILEVFSTKPAGFTNQNIELLQQLAALAERARSARPHGASSSAPREQVKVDERKPSGLLPASDRIAEVAIAFLGSRSKFLGLGFGLLAIALFALSIWLGWRGAERQEEKALAVQTSANISTARDARSSAAAIQVVAERLPDGERAGHFSFNEVAANHAAAPSGFDDDPVWKRDPGGERIFPSTGKPSAGTPLKLAAQVDRIAAAQKPDHSTRPKPLLAAVHGEAGTFPTSRRVSNLDGLKNVSRDFISADLSNHAVMNDASSEAERDSPLFIKGLSGGELIHKVAPVYPDEARRQRLEGSVALSATVAEDGTVRDVSVIKGSPLLAQSAEDAVKLWRYQPYELDGKVVKNVITIHVDFKLTN